ncbi:hypothetical protein DC31_02155 [Microbacterium sp. CH12i]|nr:hypothetical protein DC31_02155 [Microbacterium sp. CH12i]
MMAIRRGARRKARVTSSLMHKRVDEFPAQVNLGFDGLGYIVAVDTTLEEVHDFIGKVSQVSPTDVERFFGAVDAKTA